MYSPKTTRQFVERVIRRAPGPWSVAAIHRIAHKFSGLKPTRPEVAQWALQFVMLGLAELTPDGFQGLDKRRRLNQPQAVALALAGDAPMTIDQLRDVVPELTGRPAAIDSIQVALSKLRSRGFCVMRMGNGYWLSRDHIYGRVEER